MGNLRRQSLKPGDVLEVSCGRRLAYIQYVGKQPEYGDTVFVYPTLFERRPADLKCLHAVAGYLTFYPAGRAVRQGLAEVAGACPLPPGLQVPSVYRREGVTDREGKVLAWIIVRDGRETVRRRLTASERKLPIASIWNHEYLVDRIVEDWRPEQEG